MDRVQFLTSPARNRAETACESIVIGLSSTDELLNKAFQLACFILGDREAALRVVATAVAKLEVAVATQGKRLYYTPTGRLWSRRTQSKRTRNNISFNELHLLQRLIYIESEPYEIALEQGKGSTHLVEEDLVIHFIKHLTTKTTKRNSFYVTLGLSRLLYSYTTAETMDIYNAVIQDPERVKDDYYYRSRKGVLMEELKERFGELLNVSRGPRGEERFQADDNQGRFVELVRESLSFFTPWHTPCLVPAGIDPITEGIPSLSYLGHNQEDKIEVNRVHAVLHPDCFQRLTANLRFDPPETRLEVPRFFYKNGMNRNGSNSNRRDPPKLTEQELIAIKNELQDNAARRKAAHAGLLRIIVDGAEHARIDLKATGSARFTLDKDAELIEVRSGDNAGEELLLASHLLAGVELEHHVKTADASIILEGGQKISIHSSPELSDTGTVVEITYRETNLFRTASHFFHQLVQSLSENFSRSIWKDRRVLVSLLVLLFLVGVGVVLRYKWGEERRAINDNKVADKQNGAVNAMESHITPTTGNNNGLSTTEKKYPKSSNTAPAHVAKSGPPPIVARPSAETENTRPTSAPENVATAPETVTNQATNTRSLTSLPAAVPLSAVRKVYIETVGDEELAQTVRQLLGERLKASNQVSLSRTRDESDALLRVTVVRDGGPDLEITSALVELINARGDVTWTNNKAGTKYHGYPANVATSVVRDLLTAIKNSKRR